ncbi:DUF1799 domain-containing protein [Thalassovita sp.]|uniref:DUF1799 domain-containing protein n=1 Tax=Thalassovita sp. TaxID=1979401 RepID=UPI002B2681C7|nr:DUF1799 domain-containing protein [Thalassovita sp.]
MDDRQPVSIDDTLSAQFRAMGADIPPSPTQKPNSDAIEIMPENWISITAFLACETQWRAAASMAGLVWLGVDYTAADVVLRAMDVPSFVFDDLRHMERAALEVFGEAQP